MARLKPEVNEREFLGRQFETLKHIREMIEDNETQLKRCSEMIEHYTERYNYCLLRRKVLEEMSEATVNLEYPSDESES